MFEFAVSNAQWVLVGLVCVAMVATTALSTIGRRKIVRLQDEVRELSGRVTSLEMIEQRRFITELKSKGGTPTSEIVRLSEIGASQQPPAA